MEGDTEEGRPRPMQVGDRNPPEMKHSMAQRASSSNRNRDGIHLTPREVEILECLAGGLTNKEAGLFLKITPGTVKTHLLRVYEKLGAAGRTEAVVTAFRQGLIEL